MNFCKKLNLEKVLILPVFLVAVLNVTAQKKKKQDVESILDMCGCFNITFKFAETFGADQDYEYYDNYYSGALEYAFPVEQTKDKIVIQHLLVIGDTMIIKHWRQDWLYENQDLYVYDKDDTWKYKQLSKDQVKGQWTQKVFQVDDSPRYEGSGTWIHADGRDYWEAYADAPLPRREYSKRKDYNVMVRRNRQEITEQGWVHDQDNQKVNRTTKDELIAWEKGWNVYKKVDDSKCQTAIDWWASNGQFWGDVRAVWGEVFDSKKTLSLNMRADGQIMFMRMFGLGSEMEGENYDAAASRQKIKDIINMHLAEDSPIQLATN
ncbi:MAG: DUF6607 family protein [Bacteroidota bacterium]